MRVNSRRIFPIGSSPFIWGTEADAKTGAYFCSDIITLNVSVRLGIASS